MRDVEAMYRAAAEVVATAQPVGDPRGHKPEPDEYMVPADVVERLRLMLQPALKSLSAMRQVSGGF